MQFTFHGIGTAIYGERDYWPDGSFVTTEWAVLAWIPVFPTFSKRISYSQTSLLAQLSRTAVYGPVCTVALQLTLVQAIKGFRL